MVESIKTRHGRLTVYGLAIGHVERFCKGGAQVSLWLEHGAYHVREHDFNTRKRRFWLTFDNLTDARKCFDTAAHSINLHY